MSTTPRPPSETSARPGSQTPALGAGTGKERGSGLRDEHPWDGSMHGARGALALGASLPGFGGRRARDVPEVIVQHPLKSRSPEKAQTWAEELMLFPAQALSPFRLPAAWKQILPGEEQNEPPRIQGSSQAGLFLPGNASPPSTPRSPSPPVPSHPTPSQAPGLITGNHQ